MPTIEIISIGNFQGFQVKQENFGLAIREEIGEKLISHRFLFQKKIRKLKGTIMHLGNPDMRTWEKDSCFFAGLTIDWETPFAEEAFSKKKNPSHFRFLKHLEGDVIQLLDIAMEKSPQNYVIFLSDYQFGPKKKKRVKNISMSQFKSIYEENGWRFNTYYQIIK
jgi:hypothetical protein